MGITGNKLSEEIPGESLIFWGYLLVQTIESSSKMLAASYQFAPCDIENTSHCCFDKMMVLNLVA